MCSAAAILFIKEVQAEIGDQDIGMNATDAFYALLPLNDDISLSLVVVVACKGPFAMEGIGSSIILLQSYCGSL